MHKLIVILLLVGVVGLECVEVFAKFTPEFTELSDLSDIDTEEKEKEIEDSKTKYITSNSLSAAITVQRRIYNLSDKEFENLHHLDVLTPPPRSFS